MDIVAILLLVLPVVVLVGYPVVLLCAGAFALPPTRDAGPVPETLSILICTQNDAAWIDAKLETVIAAVAAWPGHAEILVGDTSTDDTAVFIERFTDRGVTLVRGVTLARLAPLARGDILVLTDAKARFAPETLPALMAPFADSRVGAVAGSIAAIRQGRARLADADTLFRRWQTATRTAEDRLFGCSIADPGLYAIRCTSMPRLPANVAEEIFCCTAAVAAGQRVAFAPDARVYTQRPTPAGGASGTAYQLNALWCRRALMNPVKTGWYAVALARALLRPAALLTLPPLWIVSGLLAGEPFWAIVFALLSMAAVLCALDHWVPDRLPGPLAPAAAGLLRLVTEATGFLLFASGRYARGGFTE